MAVIYGGWLSIIFNFRALPIWFGYTVLLLLATWHMSLQHELLHGHPTKNQWLNRLLGLFPMSVWYPYDIYRDSHIEHHQDKLLTVPGLDPEGNYLDSLVYTALPRMRRALRWVLRTVCGRLLLGPAFTIAAVWSNIYSGPLRRDFRYTRTWATHLTLLFGMLWWVDAQAGISPLFYLFAIAYPALSLAMLRSFYEHRPAIEPAHRIVINEAALPWRLLYLNNNYHAVHHDYPALAWYRIPRVYVADREGFLQRNGGFYTPGYGHLFRRYALKPIDSPIHPGLPQ